MVGVNVSSEIICKYIAINFKMVSLLAKADVEIQVMASLPSSGAVQSAGVPPLRWIDMRKQEVVGWPRQTQTHTPFTAGLFVFNSLPGGGNQKSVTAVILTWPPMSTEWLWHDNCDGWVWVRETITPLRAWCQCALVPLASNSKWQSAKQTSIWTQVDVTCSH